MVVYTETPHFYLASPIIDGHPKLWPTSIEVSTPEQARKVVDEQHERGADFIKVYRRLSRESYFAIIDESKHLNIPVEGHVPNDIGAWEASEAKQKSFEHLLGIPVACSDGEEEIQPKIIAARSSKERLRLRAEASRSHSEKKCQRLFVQFVKNNTWQVPTLTLNRTLGMLNDPQFTHDDRVRYFGGELRDGLTAKNHPAAADFAAQRELYAYDQRVVGAMFRAGDELALLVESGVSPLGALQAATRNAALFMDASDKYGALTPSKIADLVLLDADPLQDIHNTTRISEVFLAGKESDRAALDNILRRAEIVAKAESGRSSTEAEPRAVR